MEGSGRNEGNEGEISDVLADSSPVVQPIQP